MKSLYLFLIIYLAPAAHAVCTSPATRTNFNPNEVLTSTRLNSELNTIYSRANELPGDCVTDATLPAAKLVDGSIQTAKLADLSVTPSKLAASNIQISNDSGSFTTTSSTPVAVTNLSNTISASGRPIEIFLMPKSGGNCVVSLGLAAIVAAGELLFLRDATVVADFSIAARHADAGAPSLVNNFLPGSAYRYIDTPTSGTTPVYSVKASSAGSASLGISDCRLVTREL